MLGIDRLDGGFVEVEGAAQSREEGALVVGELAVEPDDAVLEFPRRRSKGLRRDDTPMTHGAWQVEPVVGEDGPEGTSAMLHRNVDRGDPEQTTVPEKQGAGGAERVDGWVAQRRGERPRASARSSEPPEAPVFEVGQVLDGRLEILSLLGAGGMAQVWEAKDHVLARRVAIKTARPKPNLPPLRKEAQALAAFSHPSLVAVYGLGNENGVEYIVMERIFGVSLSEKLRRRQAEKRPFALSEALHYLEAIAEGLAVVHQAGLAHRDVKPANVMLTPDGRIVLMDFGLVIPEYDSDLRGVIAGSPPYMAPETLRDCVTKGGGPLVDIYALGATCFELLTFEPPFRAPTVQRVCQMHVDAPVPSLRARRADVPEELDRLVAQMLCKDPSDRPPSARAIAWHLREMADRLARAKDPSFPPPPKQTIDVLIVEDDEALARIEGFYVEELFGRDHVSLRHARDGLEAIEQVRVQAPDLLLLDLHLPKLNGIEVGMQMRGDRLAPQTKFVAISAGAQERDLQLLHLLGFHHFVPKGEDMKERLHEALRPLFPQLTR